MFVCVCLHANKSWNKHKEPAAVMLRIETPASSSSPASALRSCLWDLLLIRGETHIVKTEDILLK